MAVQDLRERPALVPRPAAPHPERNPGTPLELDWVRDARVNTSAAERSIIRRAAVLTTELERLEVKFALAGQASADEIDLYSRAASNLRRLLEAVGLQRRAKDVGPTLADIIREDWKEQSGA